MSFPIYLALVSQTKKVVHSQLDRVAAALQKQATRDFGPIWNIQAMISGFSSLDDGKIVGYSVTTAHHLDIGALSPGSCGIVDAIDAYAEGLQFKAIKVYDRGV